MVMESIHLHIEGMSCQHCVHTVQRALLETDGVTSASVDLEEQEAVVQFDANLVRPEQLVAAVEEAGYQANVMAGVSL